MDGSCAIGLGLGVIGGVVGTASSGPGGMILGGIGGVITGSASCFGKVDNSSGARDQHHGKG